MLQCSWDRVNGTLGCALLLLIVEPTNGFDSYGITGVKGGAIHGEITEDATKRLGISDCDALQKAVRAPDWDQTSVVNFKLRPNNLYTPSNHFDRMSGKSSEQAFREAAFFVRTEYTKCTEFAKSGNTDASISSLGRVLHAVQDLISHSNMIDLSDEKRVKMLACIWDEEGALPAEVKLTGFDAAAEDPGKPKGDPYAHDLYSKDNPDKNAEAKLLLNNKTKYKVAYSLAVDVSEKILLRVKSEVGDKWNELSREFD